MRSLLLQSLELGYESNERYDMRLLRLEVKGYKNLKAISIDFERSKGRSLIVGLNGSGKSNLLEVLSAIFYALYSKDKKVFPKFKFSLEYYLDTAESELVVVANNNGTIELKTCKSENRPNYIRVRRQDFYRYLPDHVIAVYSGEEKRLWEDYYYSSYDQYNKQYMDEQSSYQPQRMVYLNHYYWNLIASILAVHAIDDYRKFLNDRIGIKGISAIHMEFDVPKIKANRNKRARQILDILNPQRKVLVEVPLRKYEEAKGVCGYESDLFYNMAVLSLYKDYKIVTDLRLKCSKGVEIRGLSEGEKKLLVVYGAVNILSGNNLYLFDEPDVHLHEGRKKDIYEVVSRDVNSHYIISSHSPTLAKLFNPESVIMLDNEGESCKACYGDVAKTISTLTNGEWSYVDHVLIFEKNRPLFLVEGPGDVAYIKKAIEVLSQDNAKYKQLELADILHCGGAANIQKMINELMGNLPKGKKVVAIYDRDQAGADELKKAIGCGGNRRDNKTYRCGLIYYIKLPKTVGYIDIDFVIEDYFSEQYKKKIVQSYVNKMKTNLNSLPKDLRQSVKESLCKSLASCDRNALAGFHVLLDKLCDIINGQEQVVDVQYHAP